MLPLDQPFERDTETEKEIAREREIGEIIDKNIFIY